MAEKQQNYPNDHRFEEARRLMDVKHYMPALSLWEKIQRSYCHRPPDHPKMLCCRRYIVEALHHLGMNELAMERIPALLEDLKKNPVRHAGFICRLLQTRARCLFALGQYGEARFACEEYIKVASEKFGAKHKSVLFGTELQLKILYHGGYLKEGKDKGQRCVKLFHKVHGVDRRTLIVEELLASIYSRLGEWDKATIHWQECTRLAQAIHWKKPEEKVEAVQRFEFNTRSCQVRIAESASAEPASAEPVEPAAPEPGVIEPGGIETLSKSA